MGDADRVFTVASDEALVGLIRQAKRRLVIICPALTDAVAESLITRLPDLGALLITVILDADPEVYRLGFGSEKALDKIRAAGDPSFLDLRMQSGVRIGVVVSDDVTMVFAPVAQLIEAGSKSPTKPNAIVLGGGVTDRLADAAGAGLADNRTARAAPQEIGEAPLTPAAVAHLKDDLKQNPPQQFDVARSLRVFTSKVQYVELEVSNYRFSSRQVRLPQELLDVADDELRSRVSGRIAMPEGGLGIFEIEVETASGAKKTTVDERWLTKQRKRIEDKYTFLVPRYGRVIMHTLREEFDAEIKRFNITLDRYRNAVIAKVSSLKADLVTQIVQEYLPRWIRQPHANYIRYGWTPTAEVLEAELRRTAECIVNEAFDYDLPIVRAVYKSVAPENVRDPQFLDPLKTGMRKQGVPEPIIASLFASGDAAPGTFTLVDGRSSGVGTGA
ncbi:MAG TPA: hypothetical protein VKS60_12785 [Stellaceae bacterium]|nr:hypothetical protein [Stellaceae bacterium]